MFLVVVEPSPSIPKLFNPKVWRDPSDFRIREWEAVFAKRECEKSEIIKISVLIFIILGNLVVNFMLSCKNFNMGGGLLNLKRNKKAAR
jgi:hypothetical protein